jgi:hypothetical protein
MEKVDERHGRPPEFTANVFQTGTAIARGREIGQVRSYRSEIGGPTSDVRTVKNEEIVLKTFEENLTASQSLAKWRCRGALSKRF